MDGSRVSKAEADSQIELIKRSMPAVYAAVKAKAEAIGNAAYALVRRGAGGEPNCFYAFEAGHVVGTPFDHPISDDVARLMVQFGARHCCIWPAPAAAKAEAQHGA